MCAHNYSTSQFSFFVIPASVVVTGVQDSPLFGFFVAGSSSHGDSTGEHDQTHSIQNLKVETFLFSY